MEIIAKLKDKEISSHVAHSNYSLEQKIFERKEIESNWTGLEKFNICVHVLFDWYYPI